MHYSASYTHHTKNLVLKIGQVAKQKKKKTDTQRDKEIYCVTKFHRTEVIG